MNFNEKMVALADEIRELSGTTSEKGIEDMTLDIDEANAEVVRQAALIAEILEVINGSQPLEVLEGDGQEYYTTAPSILSFRSTAPLDELQNITINGEVVDPSNYELEEGSTIVKLNIDYLKTLDVGSYEIGVESLSKTVKGNFTVAAPKLNEYGFYYDQIYTHSPDGALPAYIGFSINESNGMTLWEIDGIYKYHHLIEYDHNEGSYSFNLGSLVVSGRFSEDGNSFLGKLLFEGDEQYETTFTLGDFPDVVSDADCWYSRVMNDDEELILDCWEVYQKNETKEVYHQIKSNIEGMPVTHIIGAAFNNSMIRSIKIPTSITTIGEGSFGGCFNLTNITFLGTKEQWSAIAKSSECFSVVPATYVQCIDGQVSI